MPPTTSVPDTAAAAPVRRTATTAPRFSAARVLAVLLKELLQLRRDRLTFAMIIGVPVMQLILFGFAINVDPKRLPTAVVALDTGPYARSIVSALEHTLYFGIRAVASESAAEQLIARGDVQFAVIIPGDFSRRLLRGERPAIAVYADATDPAATGSAVAALNQLPGVALQHDLTGATAGLAGSAPPFEVRLHRRYNPEGITAYNVVPGLMGVILTMTLVMMTSMAMTRERERGTLENLLATPVRPLEMMIGKIAPYVLIGYTQVVIVLAAALLLFAVPMVGSLLVLVTGLTLFMLATLCVGFTFSTLARSQMQSMQMTMFFFLPNILLSGFMFPFRGMPAWAQWLGEALPLTHFLRVIRAVMLKGSSFAEVAHELFPIVLFILVMGTVALKRYHQTLD